MNISANDKKILRELGAQYMEYATLPIQQEKIRLWKKLNHRDMERPMVVIDQLPINELNGDGDYNCQSSDPFCRNIEWNLRHQLYCWKHFPVDMVLNPYILIPRPIQNTGFGIGVDRDTSVTDPTNGVVGQYFHNQISDYEDIQKIKVPQISLDREVERDICESMADVFDGIAPVKLQGWIMHLGIWDWLSQWMGVENCYMELMDRPEFIHAVMRHVTDAVISQIEQANKLGVFDINTNVVHCSYNFADDLPGADVNPDAPTSHYTWAFGLAQLFSAVSPAITAEFEVPYMQEIFKYFGAIYYGCCDRLDDRLDIVDRMPNIRKISCSPWSNREAFAEKLPKKYIMSNKPSPAFLAEDVFDEKRVRDDIRRTVDAAKKNGVGLELILKDISTVRYQPERLERWAEIAMSEVEG